MAITAFKYSFDEVKKNPLFSPLSASKLKHVSEELDLKRWLCFRVPGNCTIFITDNNIPNPEELWTSLKSQKIVPALSPKDSQFLSGSEGLIFFFEIAVGITNQANTSKMAEKFQETYSQALELAFVGPELQHLFNRSIWLNEKLRLKSSYFQLAVKQESVIRELSEKIFGNLEKTTLSIIGFDDYLFEILAEFKHSGLTQIYLGQKSEAIQKRIQRFLSWQISFSTKAKSLPAETDILLILSPTNSCDDLKKQIAKRIEKKGKVPLVIFDLNNHEQAQELVSGHSDIFYYDRQDIQKVIQHNQKEQRNEINMIKEWIEREVVDFYRWMETDRHYQFAEMVGISTEMQRIFEMISRIAQTDITVLISGESGTGKELVAKAIHQLSHRCDEPFLVVNCGAIPDSLIESELFGHAKGAFTGAIAAKQGLFETANHGTILLDEIAELPTLLQVKLLRFLQDGEIKRVGSNDTLKLNVRVLSATNQNLIKLLKEGTFRSDLYYRLNVVQLNLPPLRDRGEDTSLLIQHFLKKFNRKFHKQVKDISQNARELLVKYPWPGNVRELENAIERAVALAAGNNISVYDLPPHLQSFDADPKVDTAEERPTLKEVEKEHIFETLCACEWNYEEASKLLGISRTTLWRKLKEYDLAKRAN